MPYFRWTGINIAGEAKKGKQAAYSSQDLSERLLQRGIAILKYKVMYAPLFLWPINAKTKANLFKKKAQLLRAGLLLPQVFAVVVQQSSNPVLCDVLFDISCDIQHGISLSKALEKYDLFSDPIAMIMLNAGHESGNIINALESVAVYFHKQYLFNKNIRSALAMPLLTLLFFIAIAFFIFIFIIPRFAEMFSSLQQELPPLTRSMIAVSEFFCSSSMVYIFVVIGMLFFSLQRYFSYSRGKRIWNKVVDKVPFLGMIIWQYHMSQALSAVSLLVSSGVPLVVGLDMVGKTVEHCVVKSQLIELHDYVVSGQLLSNAMATMLVFLPEIVASIQVGEQSGTLGKSLEYASLVYSDTLEESLRRFIFFLQPVVIIFLGILVTLLIFAVYLPIMQLSYVI